MRKRSTKPKGDFLEEVVALLHEGPGWTVDRKARVPVRDDSKATREIDVLISSFVAGYKIQIAIECKNWSKKIESPQIDEFIGKLDDIGIPRSHGVYVSASGYTKGAVRRAAREGIQPLEIVGLGESRLESAIGRAFRHVIYLVPDVEAVQVFDEIEDNSLVIKTLRYEDPASGKPVYALDHLWKRWFFEECPKALGIQHHRFDLPQDPALFAPGEPIKPKRIFLSLRVRAAVVSVEGSITNHALRHASKGAIERQRVFLDFGAAEKYVMQIFDTEEALAAFLQSETVPSLTIGRIPLPRIIYQQFYWPLTPGALQRAIDLRRRGVVPTFENVEGVDLSRAWEFFARAEDLEYIRDDLVSYQLYP